MIIRIKKGWRHTSLASQISLILSATTFVMAALIAILAYTVVKGVLIGNETSSALSQATSTAQLLSGANSEQKMQGIFNKLSFANSSYAYLLTNNDIIHTPGAPPASELPAPSLSMPTGTNGSSNTIARNTWATDVGLDYSIVTSVSIPNSKSLLIEVTSLSTLETALTAFEFFLLISVILCAVVASFIGHWATRLTLRPLKQVAQIAASIQAGNLEERALSDVGGEIEILSKAVNGMADALSERILREKRFSADVSHELRSPLHTLATTVALLENRRSSFDDKSNQALDLLIQEISRFQTLVINLLELSRLDAGTSEGSYEEVVFSDLITHCLEAQREFSLDIIDRDQAGAATVLVDRRRIERVVANLISNAHAYGGGPTKVVLTKQLENSTVRFGVHDSGPGVDPTEREKVFERFHRGQSAGSRGHDQGSGLGLTLVMQHVRRHGGRTWIEESDSGGAAVIVELPVVRFF
ncbi:MAG: HAMP domain-containing histidine kinase [Acidimicrobiales bacterium]|nr:HAMP domain-containing histidine kinase [Acidimicrobiales bacterium]